MSDKKAVQPNLNVQEIHAKERNLTFNMNGLAIEVMWLAHVPNDRIWHYEKHKDTGFEFHIIPKGKCTVTIDDHKPQEVESGQLFIIPPGVYHAQQSNPEHPAVEYGLHCNIAVDTDHISEHEEEANFIQQFLHQKEVTIVPDHFHVAETFECLFQEDKQQQFGYHSHLKVLIYTIILNSIRATAISLGTESTLLQPDVNELRMKEIDQLINQQLETNLTLQDLSALLYLSERQINRVVLNARGQTFRKYVTDVKLQKTRVWLADPQIKIHEIAMKLGFSSSYHFSQAFKKKHGFLPSEMKKLLK